MEDVTIQDAEAAAAADKYLEGEEMNAMRQAASDAGLPAIANAIRCAFMAGYLCGKHAGMEEALRNVKASLGRLLEVEV